MRAATEGRAVKGIRDRLGQLCDQLTRHGSMATEIEAAGAGPELTELLGLLATGADAGAPDHGERLGELLDTVEEACARHGLVTLDVRGPADARPGSGRLPPGFGPATDGGTANGTVDAWVCPWARCGRVVFPEETADRPICAAGAAPLHSFPPR
ncbi:hypothetical protein [Streptomyces albogriseolus]|uniref:hypothetical protein n=1 Tax=Streptomyces albogriseolus TaxID=1887 RepID=UPI0033A70D01